MQMPFSSSDSITLANSVDAYDIFLKITLPINDF